MKLASNRACIAIAVLEEYISGLDRVIEGADICITAHGRIPDAPAPEMEDFRIQMIEIRNILQAQVDEWKAQDAVEAN